jgi:tetratricopeptide (TPR) repeat protein
MARSVALLPHDRTHEQRQRERSEFSLLSLREAWLPPIFAVLALMLELTMWEHAVVATGEMLNVLIFATIIRCLLEYRISQKDGWLFGMSLLYGLGITNNYALIAFFPLFLVALIWIKGLAFFRPKFLGIMALLGLIGLSLYLLLPAVYASYDSTHTFMEWLRYSLGNHKSVLTASSLRNRVVILSLTSILPIFMMGIRWPSSFGDTSAAGATVTNVMFRVVHLMFLTACIFITLDQKFSPRALGFGLPFLTYYYLGALAIGYYSGYALLVFGHTVNRKAWRKSSSGIETLLNPLLFGGVCLAALALPVWLFQKNAPLVRVDNGKLLRQFVDWSVENAPRKGAVLLSEDLSQIALLESVYAKDGPDRNILVNTRSLDSPAYHDSLVKKYPGRWPKPANMDPKGKVDGTIIQPLITELARTNQVFYLQPSFGYFFETLEPEAHGSVYRLVPANPARVIVPQLSPAQIQENAGFWKKTEPVLARLQKVSRTDNADMRFLATYYSRALNYWGVELQKGGKLAEASQLFDEAMKLNSNNIPAIVNHEFNGKLKANKPPETTLSKITEDKFGKYRSWDAILAENGPFDEPSYASVLGDSFLRQALYRQAALQFERIKTLVPDNMPTRLSLGQAYLFGRWPDQALETVREARLHFQKRGGLALTNDLELVAMEAGVYFAKTNFVAAEKLLRESLAAHPGEKILLESLTELFRSTGRDQEAISILDQRIALNPVDLSPRMVKADIYMKAQDYPKAREEVDKVLKVNPNNSPALLYRAFVALRAKDYKQSLADVKHILSADPDNVQALIYEGIVNLESKNYEQGIPPLDKAVKLQPDNWVALQNRAILNLQAGHLDKAKTDYVKLLAFFPETHAIYYGLGEIAYRQKNKEEALKNYELYLKYAPTNGTPEQVTERNQVSDRIKDLKSGR